MEINNTYRMTITDYTIRSAPIALPVLLIFSMTMGLVSRLGSFPSIDNLMLVCFASIVSGILPGCFLSGLGVFALNWYKPSKWWVGLLLIFMAIAMSLGVYFGRGLDF